MTTGWVVMVTQGYESYSKNGYSDPAKLSCTCGKLFVFSARVGFGTAPTYPRSDAGTSGNPRQYWRFSLLALKRPIFPVNQFLGEVFVVRITPKRADHGAEASA